MDELEKVAANAEDDSALTELEEEELEDSDSPTEDTEEPEVDENQEGFKKGKEGAKAYAERLKKDRAKLIQEERDKIAKDMGYETYEEFQKANLRRELENDGYNFDDMEPIIKKVIKLDPEYQKLREKVEEATRLEAERWVSSQLRDFNTKYGTKYKNVEDVSLNDTARALWEKSDITLEQAILITSPDMLTKRTTTSTVQANREDSGKSHLKTTTNSGAASNDSSTIIVTDEDVSTYSDILGGSYTKEEVYEMKKKLQEYRNRKK